MDFNLTPSQQMTRRAVREFVRKEVTPLSREFDESDEFPTTIYRQALALEVLDLALPESLGGIGGDFLSFVIALEEFACGSAALAHSIAASETMVHLLSRQGSDQQQRHLPGLLTGQTLGAAALWGPEANREPPGSVRAVPDAEGYRLTGTLQYVPFVPIADLTLVFATAEDVGSCALILEQRNLGAGTTEVQPLMGMRGFPLGRLVLEGARAAGDQLLGDPGMGQQIFEATLMRCEVAAGAIAVGLSQTAMEAAVNHSKARVQFGKTLSEMEATQNKIADMAAGIQAARLLVYEAAVGLDSRKQPVRHTAAAKLAASETAVAVCREALQIHGGYGYIKDYPVERLYRDALFCQAFPTVNTAQRRTIAKQTYRRIR